MHTDVSIHHYSIGQRAIVKVPHQRGGKMTLCAAISHCGVLHHLATLGPFNIQHFLTFLGGHWDVLFECEQQDHEQGEPPVYYSCPLRYPQYNKLPSKVPPQYDKVPSKVPPQYGKVPPQYDKVPSKVPPQYDKVPSIGAPRV